VYSVFPRDRLTWWSKCNAASLAIAGNQSLLTARFANGLGTSCHNTCMPSTSPHKAIRNQPKMAGETWQRVKHLARISNLNLVPRAYLAAPSRQKSPGYEVDLICVLDFFPVLSVTKVREVCLSTTSITSKYNHTDFINSNIITYGI
jgi:hypothetical protein